jgi:hypothetical protein
MGRFAIVVAVLAMLMPTLAWGDWDYVHWGMTPEQVAQASGGAVNVLPPAKRTTHPAPFNSETAAEGLYTEGALKLNLSFSFDLKSGGLTCVIFASEDPSQNELFKQSFMRRYGPPDDTGGFADAGMYTYTWYKPDEVGLTLMEGGQSFASQCKPGTIPPLE